VQFWRQYAMAEYRAAERRRRQRIAEYNARMEQIKADKAEALKAASEALS
jgi:hypothetical protein